MKERRVRFTATARQHVERERTWWLENRDYREVFVIELEAAVRVLAILPGAGSPYTQPGFQTSDGSLEVRKLTCQDGNSPNARNLSDGHHESAQPVEQLLTVTLGGDVHRRESIERRNLAERHQDLDRTRPTRCSSDQAAPFEAENHVMN